MWQLAREGTSQQHGAETGCWGREGAGELKTGAEAKGERKREGDGGVQR